MVYYILESFEVVSFMVQLKTNPLIAFTLFAQNAELAWIVLYIFIKKNNYKLR